MSSATLKPMPAALNTKPYTMPPLEVGDIVHWWPYAEMGEGQEPQPAIIIKVGTRTVQLASFAQLLTKVIYKDGVRHINDPDAKRDEFVEVGAWSTKAETVALRKAREAAKAQAEADKEEAAKK